MMGQDIQSQPEAHNCVSMLLEASRFRGLFRMAHFQRMFNPFNLDTIDLHFWLCACISVNRLRSSLDMSHQIDWSQEPHVFCGRNPVNECRQVQNARGLSPRRLLGARNFKILSC